jgi:hypothetical protein
MRTPSTTTTPDERVLCAHCGHPVTYRRVLIYDCPVTPEGDLQREHDAENEYESQQDNGLYCVGCEDFITNKGGYNADHELIPQLLKKGRLRLAGAVPAKRKPRKW